MFKERIFSILVIIAVVALGYFYLVQPEIKAREDSVISQEEKGNLFKLGLDLVGGSQLTYDADISELEAKDVSGAMESLKETLNRRLNPFGTSEVSIVVEDESMFSKNNKSTKRLVIQIPGESDPEEAKRKIGKMPLMEFKILKKIEDKDIEALKADLEKENEELKKEGKESVDIQKEIEKVQNKSYWENTKLSGANVKNAQLVYDPQTSEPVVQVKFDDEGGEIFAKLTKDHVGDVIGIFLDAKLISDPVIRDVIKGGTTIISFGSNQSASEKLKEATDLSRNLRYGALPVKVSSVSSNIISASLGKDILEKGLVAGFWGIITIMFFLVLVYRFSGFLASIALASYVVITLSLFKFFGFVFTAAGIAGFIVSIGMAVDANVLIFEMVKDELRKGSKIMEAVRNGFSRAWLSIRDGNISSILTAIILFYMTTSLVQGFALTFGFGVLTSMFSAILITRVFLLSAVGKGNKDKTKRFLFGNYKKN